MANSIDGDDYEHGDARSDLSDVEILDPADDESANATSASAAEAGWVKEGPLANWEVAYVYAFLYKFTTLVSVESADSLLSSVTDLETALLECSPVLDDEDSAHELLPASRIENKARNGSISSLSSLDSASPPRQESEGTASRDTSMTVPTSDAPARARSTPPKALASEPTSLSSQPVPPASPLILDIIHKFQDTLLELVLPTKSVDAKGKAKQTGHKKGWQNFLLDFVDARLIEMYGGGLRWQSNYLALFATKHKPSIKETEIRFWKLTWEDKIHLLRILVDFQLTNCPSIRAKIAPKHQAGGPSLPRLKDCVIEPTGTIGGTKPEKVVWQIDNSPRLYVCHDPYTRDSAFETATATVKQYRTLMRSLPKLSKAPVVNNGKKVSSSKPASFASIFANVPATKGKAKEKDVKSGNANEVALRRALKAKLPAVLEFDTARKALKGEREQAREAKQQEQLRLEQQILLKATRAAEARARSLRVVETEAPEEVMQYNGARSSRLQKMKLPTYVEPTERGLGYEGEAEEEVDMEVVAPPRARSTRAGKSVYEDDEEDYSENVDEEIEEPEEEQAFEPETQETQEEIAVVPEKVGTLVKKQRKMVESEEESSAQEESDFEESEEEVVALKTKSKPNKKRVILDSDDDEEMQAKPKKKAKSKKRESDYSSASDLSALSDEDEDDLLPAHSTSKAPKKQKAKLDNFIVSDSEAQSESASDSE